MTCDERIRRQELRECERREAIEAALSKKKTVEKQSEENKIQYNTIQLRIYIAH